MKMGNMNKGKINSIVLYFLLLSGTVLHAQISRKELTGSDLNAIQSAVPFLTIAPDSRSGAMGDVGVATSPDLNSMHWNPAKFAFIAENAGIGLSYTPWLRTLVPDINLAYLTGYKRIDRQQVVSASLLYFSLGEIIFTDQEGQIIKPFNPNEFAIDAAYSRLFSDRLSGGIAFRFIRSDLTGELQGETVGETKAGISFAADISTYYQREVELGDKSGFLAIGANISNIGTKISYTSGKEKEFIPINLRVGTSMTVDLDDFNKITLSLDLNKLLVPTPPIYYQDGDTLPDGSVVVPGERIIQYGMDPNVSVPVGMLHSFYDAPGGFKEEMQEIMIGAGLEYLYRKQFAIRTGYFYENQWKGNRKYFAFGVGLKLNVFAIDFAYLVPTTGRNNPLANTVRFTLSFLFDKNKSNS
jgi:hypothetical protein